VSDTRRGLFDGFEGYRTLTDDDYRSALTAGLVVPDSNVLLNLYRYNEQARADLFAVLQRLGSRLWIPHQVLKEFWRNRESAILDKQTQTEKTLTELWKKQDESIAQLRNWSKRVALPDEALTSAEDALLAGFTETAGAISIRHRYGLAR
jgi:rRNA-processing protein FCF1